MRDMTQFETWLEKVNEERNVWWDARYSYKGYEPLTYTKGRNYIKIMDGTSVWGFVSMKDIPNKGYQLGDLLKAASHQTPAPHSRGNIFNGTDAWEYYGPKYLK